MCVHGVNWALLVYKKCCCRTMILFVIRMRVGPPLLTKPTTSHFMVARNNPGDLESTLPSHHCDAASAHQVVPPLMQVTLKLVLYWLVCTGGKNTASSPM